MSIIKKFSFMMALIIILIILVGVSTLFLVEKDITNIINEETTGFIANEVYRLELIFNNYIKRIEVFTQQTDIINAINASNLTYGALENTLDYIKSMDQDWIAGGESSIKLFKELVGNELSQEINKIILFENYGDTHGPIQELFITNRFGAVIGLANKTTDFRQDDEEWWQHAKENGIYTSGLIYDESAASWQINIALALRLADGSFAGVVKAGINVEWITRLVGSQLNMMFKHSNRNNIHWYLLTQDGLVLYSSESFTFLQHAPPSIDFARMKQLGHGLFSNNNKDNAHTDIFVISNGVSRLTELGWIFLLRHDNDYLFGASNTIKKQIIIAMLVVIGISLLFGVKILQYLNFYTKKITTWTDEIGQGNFAINLGVFSANDELGKLAGTLQLMMMNLQRVTVSHDKLQQEIQEKINTEQLLRKERDFNKLLLNSTADGIYGIDLDGNCIFINQSGLSLLGFSTMKEVIGQEIHTLIHHSYPNGTPYPKAECPVCRSMAPQQQILVADDVFWHQDQHSFPVEYSAHPIHQDDIRVGTIAIFRDISTRKAYEALLQHAANYDFLTGLPNRYLFFQLLHHALRQAERLKTLVAIIFVDIDHFKNVNDTFGHNIGDRLLQLIAAVVKECIRTSDIIARFAGDEFAIFCENFHCVEQIENFATNLGYKINSKLFDVDGLLFHVTASLGIAIYPFIDDTEKLLQQAEIAMYHAKKLGGNCCKYFSWEMQDEISQHVKIEKALHIALENNEFELYFQPKQNLASGCLVGMEALLRLHSSILGSISPMVFIPIAEDTGHIVEIGKWVLRKACETFVSWPPAITSSLIMSVNISAAQIQDVNFIRFLEQVLSETGMDGRHLELEITESTIMKNTMMIHQLLQTLRAQGMRIAIDDFGTGYSSLGYLKHLTIDTLKIDRAFITNIATNQNDQAIVSAIIAMAHHLGLHVIAEGAEEEAHVAILRANGCDEIQGFFYAKPLAEKEFKKFCLQQPVELT